jgi:hypothetical protein
MKKLDHQLSVVISNFRKIKIVAYQMTRRAWVQVDQSVWYTDPQLQEDLDLQNSGNPETTNDMECQEIFTHINPIPLLLSKRTPWDAPAPP